MALATAALSLAFGAANVMAQDRCTELSYDQCLRTAACSTDKFACVSVSDPCAENWAVVEGEDGCLDQGLACEFVPAGTCYCPLAPDPEIVSICVCGGGPPPQCISQDTD